MAQKGLLVIDEKKRYRLNATFWEAWEEKLPSSFHFEELLVWLFAFSGFADSITSWELLSVDFQERYLGSGERFPGEYNRRFHVGNSVPWPSHLLSSRPSNETYQKALLPSRFASGATTGAIPAPVIPETNVDILVGEFDAALTAAKINFGSSHAEIVRSFVVSILSKPFVIITGLSGSGKTQIAKKFGEWLGDDRYLLVPVRPDWSTADALFGYENLLDNVPNHRWIVPDTLRFMLRAASNVRNPYLLILDEMNLAHVERYFGDFLSGMESGNDVIPNLEQDSEGAWRLKAGTKNKLPIPSNLIVIGTVNVDETTYMFSPKVLDRANTLEFRVLTDDLSPTYTQPKPCKTAEVPFLEGLVRVMMDRKSSENTPGEHASKVSDCLLGVHRILFDLGSGFEFGHRIFNEAIRFAALFEAAGGDWKDAVDAQIHQKVLPRLHGSQRAIGSTLRSLGHYCLYMPINAGESLSPQGRTFNFDVSTLPELPLSYQKLRRMFERLRLNQFTAFTE